MCANNFFLSMIISNNIILNICLNKREFDPVLCCFIKIIIFT